MHKNIVEPGVTISRTRIACCINKATETHSEFIILGVFPLQQRLQKRAWALRYTYIACPAVLCCVFVFYLAVVKLKWIELNYQYIAGKIININHFHYDSCTLRGLLFLSLLCLLSFVVCYRMCFSHSFSVVSAIVLMAVVPAD